MQLAELGANLQEALPGGAELAHGLLAAAAHLGRPWHEKRIGEALLGIAVAADLAPRGAEPVAVQGEHPHFDLLACEAGKEVIGVLLEPCGGLGGVAEAITIAIDHEDEEILHGIVTDDVGHNILGQGLIDATEVWIAEHVDASA